MNSSTKNPLESSLSKELVESISKPSVKENTAVQSNLSYPPVESPLSTVKVSDKEYSIVDEAGNIVGKVTSNLFTLGQKTVETVSNVVSSVVQVPVTVATSLRDAVLGSSENEEPISRSVSVPASMAANASNQSSRSAPASMATNASNQSSRSAPASMAANASNQLSRSATAPPTIVENIDNQLTRLSTVPVSMATAVSKQLSRAATVSGSMATTVTNELSRAATAPASIVASAANQAENVVSHLSNSVSALGSAATNVGSELFKSASVVVDNGENSVIDFNNNLTETSSNILNGLKDLSHKSTKNATVVGDEAINIGTTALNTSKSLIEHVIDGVENVATSVTKTVSNVLGVSAEGVDKAQTSVLNIGSKTIESVNDVANTATSGLSTITSGTIKAGETVYDAGVNTVNTLGSSASNITSRVTSGISTAGVELTETGDDLIKQIRSSLNNVITELQNIGSKVSGTILPAEQNSVRVSKEVQSGGVSVLNISNDSTRMLIPNNFLTTKHVYFVKYHNNGTNVYDYKMSFKGGEVSNLNLKNIENVWNNNKPVDPMTNTSIVNGIKILNNLINDLTKSTQVGGYVQQRVSDKDQYYHEYKNYKLQYMKSKN